MTVARHFDLLIERLSLVGLLYGLGCSIILIALIGYYLQRWHPDQLCRIHTQIGARCRTGIYHIVIVVIELELLLIAQ